uniref:Putative LOC100902024 [Metaseiulus occidentalis] n=1 Tax=Lepeophtheirus salmonis TaxID=72036 RepID=A0A0K2UQ55_LEPSM
MMAILTSFLDGPFCGRPYPIDLIDIEIANANNEGASSYTQFISYWEKILSHADLQFSSMMPPRIVSKQEKIFKKKSWN